MQENIKHEVKCPKWQELFLSGLNKNKTFEFNLEAINHNL